MYSWDLNRGEINEIANELYEENDENYTADEYMITYVNECNTHDEPVSKPDEWMAKEIHDSENACARKWEGKDSVAFKLRKMLRGP